MDNIIANVADILKFLNYRNESLSEQEYEGLLRNVIDVYNIKHKTISDDIITTIKKSFEVSYKFAYVIGENNEDDINGDHIIIDAYDMKNNTSVVKPVIMNNFMTVEERDDEYDRMMLQLKPTLTGKLRELADHYDHLKNLPQPVQKSKEWFDMRNNMITASMAADILGHGHFGTREEALLGKLNVLPDQFKENMFVYHGKKYEKIAIMIYEHLFNTKVGEFGLIPYQNNATDKMAIDFIGASPDGINMCVTLDGKPNPKVGRMVEIKCPLKRKILTQGAVNGDICPGHYWMQVQLQEASCKNEECDFFQCNIQEYDEDYWAADTSEEPDECKCTAEQNQTIPIPHKLTKGVIIQLLPNDLSRVPAGDLVQWHGKYIYPSNLLMSDEEYESWVKYMQKEWKNLYPQLKDDYRYDKVLYWKLRSCHNVLIKRDITWFEESIPQFKQFWDEVLDARRDEHKKKKYLDNYLKKKRPKKEVPVDRALVLSKSSRKKTDDSDEFIDSEKSKSKNKSATSSDQSQDKTLKPTKGSKKSKILL